MKILFQTSNLFLRNNHKTCLLMALQNFLHKFSTQFPLLQIFYHYLVKNRFKQNEVFDNQTHTSLMTSVQKITYFSQIFSPWFNSFISYHFLFRPFLIVSTYPLLFYIYRCMYCQMLLCCYCCFIVSYFLLVVFSIQVFSCLILEITCFI